MTTLHGWKDTRDYGNSVRAKGGIVSVEIAYGDSPLDPIISFAVEYNTWHDDSGLNTVHFNRTQWRAVNKAVKALFKQAEAEAALNED